MRAIILAAGKGTRFEGKVKSLLKINEETIIGRLIRQLKSAGIKPIYVVTGFKAEKFLELPYTQIIVKVELYDLRVFEFFFAVDLFAVFVEPSDEVAQDLGVGHQHNLPVAHCHTCCLFVRDELGQTLLQSVCPCMHLTV